MLPGPSQPDQPLQRKKQGEPVGKGEYGWERVLRGVQGTKGVGKRGRGRAKRCQFREEWKGSDEDSKP
jgi:hypothetical protein